MCIRDRAGIVAWAKKEGIGLMVVGPELPLTLGLVDALAAVGIKAFGPTSNAAELEGSKVFSKNLMQKYGVPTAKYGVFSDVESALEFSREIKGPWVVKADGLAAGKGVLICQSMQETEEAIRQVLVDRALSLIHI